ncbi:hypothetical protein ACH5RR_009806 [Cinchona calisaya]|uniref:Uncharacterized protein n=1 Tax=Cinchona calisaya TaxID=153742 RepID=A0ABD3AFR5_9GENT
MSKADALEEQSSSKGSQEEEDYDEKTKKSENIINIDDEECKTPISQDQKIPAPQSCPPAPRKRKRGVSCKRKKTKLQFFENNTDQKEEVESFFRSSSCEISTSVSVAPETTRPSKKKRRKNP